MDCLHHRRLRDLDWLCLFLLSHHPLLCLFHRHLNRRYLPH
jgi:hypothetical protein